MHCCTRLPQASYRHWQRARRVRDAQQRGLRVVGVAGRWPLSFATKSGLWLSRTTKRTRKFYRISSHSKRKHPVTLRHNNCTSWILNEGLSVQLSFIGFWNVWEASTVYHWQERGDYRKFLCKNLESSTANLVWPTLPSSADTRIRLANKSR